MHSLTELEEVLLSNTSVNQRDCLDIIKAIRYALSVNPSLISELAPGKVLIQRPMTPKERAKVSVLAMNLGKQKRRKNMLAAAEPIVREVRAARATANGHEIAMALNQKCDYGPSKNRETWTYADVRLLLKDLGIEFKPTES